MQYHVIALTLGVSAVLSASANAADDVAGTPAPSNAQHLLMEGKYAEAAELFAQVAETTPPAAVGLARCMAARGKLDEAARTLDAFQGEHADVEAEAARLAFARGDYQAAATHVENALRLDQNQLLARWLRGELFRTSGRLPDATDAYRWLIRFYNRQDVDRAESLDWIGQAAARYAEWNRAHDQYGFLVNELYPDAVKLEPDYWPAHLRAGLLFLEKYNQRDAAAEFQAALELNPNAAEVHCAIAQLALVGHDYDKAQTSVDRALEINPNLADAWLVKADLAWANFDVEQAERILKEQVLSRNPVSEDALGRLAAVWYLNDDEPQLDSDGRFPELVARVTAKNARAGEFFFSLARWLNERHKMPQAERFLQETIRRMPEMTGPRSSLGLIYMHMGREDEGGKALREAFQVDPFNIRVKNTLEVLEVLDTMETVEAGGCLLRFDGRRDRILASYAAQRLETVYPQLCERFGFRPKGKPLVEVFNQAAGHDGHKWFSTRLLGLPYLGTVAASTGRIVAMVSPNEPSLGRPFNWARTLDHELVHVLTLQQTNFNIPHWYTEALAVMVENQPRPQAWNELLANRFQAGELLNLDSINFAFTRPDSSDDWTMAYCQAELYVDYMLDGRDDRVLVQLLEAYAENLNTSQAIQRVFGLSLEEFERGYSAYVERVVAGLAIREARPVVAFADLLQRQRENPNDADTAAEVAYAHVRRAAHDEARRMAQHAIDLSPNHPLAVYVLARVDLHEGNLQQAVSRLEDTLDRDSPQPRLLNLLAGLKLKAKQYTEAAELYQLGATSNPGDLAWIRSLKRVYVWSQNDEPLADVLETLALADKADLAARKKLIELALQRQDYDQAARWARQAMEIDVMDAEIHGWFAEALAASNNYERAVVEFRWAIELAPLEPRWRFHLAEAYLQLGDRDKALSALETLLKRNPEYPGAAGLLETLLGEDDEP